MNQKPLEKTIAPSSSRTSRLHNDITPDVVHRTLRKWTRAASTMPLRDNCAAQCQRETLIPRTWGQLVEDVGRWAGASFFGETATNAKYARHMNTRSGINDNTRQHKTRQGKTKQNSKGICKKIKIKACRKLSRWFYIFVGATNTRIIKKKQKQKQKPNNESQGKHAFFLIT